MLSPSALTILIVDDDASLRNMLQIILKKEGYGVLCAEDSRTALDLLKTEKIGLVISDIKMPDLSGIELLKKIKGIDMSIPVIMITAYASTADAVEAMKIGAENYVTKPFNIDELKVVVSRAISRRSLEVENTELRRELSGLQRYGDIVGGNRRMLQIYDLVDTISRTDSTVLITGESGTGKELIARAIHDRSPRADHHFVSINCGALPENLLESELFGHIKGAFTDAYRDKPGLFEQAHQGTLFLDEIAEMSQKMQVKLLRAIQERTIRRVGGEREIPVDVRIISATNRDLAQDMKEGVFRSDLFYRLNVISIRVPALRERRDDILSLMNFFLAVYNRRFNKQIRGFSDEVISQFMQYNWPGNVRELENFVERAVALEKDSQVSMRSLPSELLYHVSENLVAHQEIRDILQRENFSFSEYIDDLSRRMIEEALEMNGSNIKRTAEMLHLSYRSLRYLIEKYGLK
ncbi:MAG: sigma-54 dependent transcriptional regulator [Acidobacteriota bacterium]|jgi:DNA-binding NtrC family response regulator|nr:sigma-54 dependent transcriptional regulator [Acidobacteriota bacterium]